MSERSLRAVGQWLDRYPQGNILFVSHDAVMQSMVEALCRHWFDNRHGTPFRFARTGDVWRVDEVARPSSSLRKRMIQYAAASRFARGSATAATLAPVIGRPFGLTRSRGMTTEFWWNACINSGKYTLSPPAT